MGDVETATREMSGCRPRRPHMKSRTGCEHCKRRKIKCDELKPRCSRCERGDLSCNYPNKLSTQSPTETRRLVSGLTCEAPGQDGLASQGLSTATFSSAAATSPHFGSDHTTSGLVDAKDQELFNHYVQHTSRAVNFDEDDFFALQVGIPSLATRCPPLMNSVLALAAACSACDILSHPAPIPGDRDRVIELLALANRHHLNSLQEIQATISTSRQYDQILANALLMATYGAASQRVRIWLANSRLVGEALADEFLPNNPGWLSLFYAVHAAYNSLIKAKLPRIQINQVGLVTSSPPASGQVSQRVWRSGAEHEEELSPSVKQPRNVSSHILYPILAATSATALKKLQEKVHAISISIGSVSPDLSTIGMVGSPDGDAANTIEAQIRACQAAMGILSSIASDIFFGQSSSFAASPTLSQLTVPELDFGSATSILPSEIPNWLQTYLARALAVTPSRPLRRVVLAFLYRVPQQYLRSIQRMLDTCPAETRGVDDVQPRDSEEVGLEINDAEHLSIEIFAHWLVFVLLLDGVWWIGDIGFWELGRIVTSVRNRYFLLIHSTCGREDWWPSSMYNVVVEFRKHVNR